MLPTLEALHLADCDTEFCPTSGSVNLTGCTQHAEDDLRSTRSVQLVPYCLGVVRGFRAQQSASRDNCCHTS
jgi:hypothetical protein